MTKKNKLDDILPLLRYQFNQRLNEIENLSNPHHPTSFDQLTRGSSRRVWWTCSQGHSWKTRVSHRFRGARCFYCSGKGTWLTRNTIDETHPRIAAEWDFDKNTEEHQKNSDHPVSPSQVNRGSNVPVWWRCSKGHRFVMLTVNRTSSGQKCPVCMGIRVIAGENDLATLFPAIASEWDYQKNEKEHSVNNSHPVSPSQIGRGSGFRIWWRCVLGHSWRTAVCDRVGYLSGCPYCSGKKALPGFNDLLLLYPDIAREWDYRLNLRENRKNPDHPVSPSLVRPGSNVRAWWRCARGHSWCVKIDDRVSHQTSCPTCMMHFQTSKGEGELADAISQLLPRGVVVERNVYGVLTSCELDVFVPELHLAFEYNGDRWHSEEMSQKEYGKSATERHGEKAAECDDNNIMLYYVWESDWKNRRNDIISALSCVLSCSLQGELCYGGDILNILSKG